MTVTITLGAKQYGHEISLLHNIEAVDIAMYKGKQAGRNTVYSD